jgi:xanthosine utilization system XapX-like protein
MIKKILRGIIKIPATPFVVVGLVGMILVSYLVQFCEWLYEADVFDKKITAELKNDYITALKKWFTTI